MRPFKSTLGYKCRLNKIFRRGNESLKQIVAVVTLYYSSPNIFVSREEFGDTEFTTAAQRHKENQLESNSRLPRIGRVILNYF
jgi:hypothetical protein